MFSRVANNIYFILYTLPINHLNIIIFLNYSYIPCIRNDYVVSQKFPFYFSKKKMCNGFLSHRNNCTKNRLRKYYNLYLYLNYKKIVSHCVHDLEV